MNKKRDAGTETGDSPLQRQRDSTVQRDSTARAIIGKQQ